MLLYFVSTEGNQMSELLRSRENILSDLVRSILSNTDLDDVSPGSTLSILLDSLSGILYQNQLLVLKILESTSLETLTGVDLDRKAASIGLANGTGGVGRRPASTSSGLVTISSSFKEINGKLYSGKPAPFAGSSVLYVEDASKWPISGSLYIGRGTASNLEGPVPYTIGLNSNFTLYWQVNLGGILTKNHSLSETVNVAQGGDRIVSAGTILSTTPNANSPAILYKTDQQLLIPDGITSGSVSVTSLDYGDQTNASAGSINSFNTLAFVGATVTNPTAFVSGISTESDEDLRQRIRDYPATLARGTSSAISAALLGLSDSVTGKTISSAVVVEPTAIGNPSMIYINDGSLLEPSFSGQPYELLLSSASGQETQFNTAQFPITPCVAIGANVAPFALVDQEELIITIDGITETYKVTGSNYVNLASVSSFEIIRDFNSQANICAFRTVNGGSSVVVFDISGNGEIMTVSPGDLQIKLGLSTAEIRSIYLYKNSKLLSFKGKTATLATSAYPWNLLSTDIMNVQIIVDSSTQTFSVTNADFSPLFSTISTASLANWATVLNGKLSGVKVTVVGNTLVWSSFQENSSNSYLEIPVTQVKPAAFFANAGICTIVTAQNHGLTGNPTITISSSSMNNLDGTYIATVLNATALTITTSLGGSGVLFYSDPNSVNVGWVGNSKIWPTPTVLTPLSSQGASQDYTINRYLGELQLINKPKAGDKLEIATQQTRAQISANVASAGIYSVAPSLLTTGNSRLVVSFDGIYVLKDIFSSANSNVLVTPFLSERIIRLTAYVQSIIDLQLFSAASVGDYLYIAPDASVPNPFGPILPSLSSCFLIKDIASDKSWIEFEVSSSEYTDFTTPGYTLPVPFIYNITSNMFSLFSSTTTPQIIDFGTASTVTVDTAISIINEQVKSGSAQKISSTEFVLRSNDYSKGSVAVLAVIGNAINIFSKDIEQNIQPHQAAVKSDTIDRSFPVFTLVQKTKQDKGKATRSYIKTSSNFTNIISTGVNPTVQADASVTSYPLGSQELWVTGKLSGYSGRTYHLNQTVPFQGFLRTDNYINNIGTFDTAAPLYDDYRNISLKCQTVNFSITDKMVFELDLDAIGKTVSVPMAKKAQILSIDPLSSQGIGSTINCQLADPDDLYGITPSPRPFFDQYSPFQTFNLEDFRILAKSVGVYTVSGGDRALVLRSTTFGGTSKLKLSIRYPLAANQSALKISHKSGFAANIPETYVLAYLTSGVLAQNVTQPGSLNITAIPSGGLASITFSHIAIDPSKFTTGNILNFGGNHPLSGAYLITSSGSGFATVLAPSDLNYSTVPVTGLTLSTQSSSSTVQVSQTGHGYSNGDFVNVTATSICNGISAANSSIVNAPITIVDLNTYTYIAASVASGPVAGNMTMSFPYASRTITVTPGSTTIVVTQNGHNLLNGDQIDITSAPVAGLGGISQSNLQIPNAFVTRVNANQYSYSALASAPSQSASIQLSTTKSATFSTDGLTNVINVYQPAHGYATGAQITFTGADVTGTGLLAYQLNITAIVTRSGADNYTYTVSAPTSGVVSANVITASYGPTTGLLTINPGSSIVNVTLSGHGLYIGASPTILDLTALGGAGGLTSVQLTVLAATLTVTNASQFTYSISPVVAPAISGPANVRRSTANITVSVPNGFQTTAGLVNATLTNHRLFVGDLMTFVASMSIGGISAVNLSISATVGSPQLSINSPNTFSFIANAASPTQTTLVSVVKPTIVSCTQYPLSSYPVIGKSLDDITTAINAYLPSNPIATCQAIGSGTSSNLVLNATYIEHPQLTPFIGVNATMETNYDYHSFSCKYSGHADIYTYPQPSQFPSLIAYLAATTGNAVQLLVQTVEGLFPTTSEASPTPYTPAGEIVYIVPTNARTLTDWLSFPAISSLSVLSSIDTTSSLSEIQISSKLQGAAGAVQTTGVTANSANMFINGVGTTVFDPSFINQGGNGAVQVSVGYASVLPFVSGSIVKVSNNQTSELLRPYRTIPTTLSSTTASNDIDVNHFFRDSTEIKALSVSSNSTRVLFKRFGTGIGQTEPLNVNNSVTVDFLLTEPDNITLLPVGVVRVKVSDLSTFAYLAARTGDMMVIRGSTVKNLVSAVFQGITGNTVRYTFAANSNSMGISVGQSLVVTGFTNIQNNTSTTHPTFVVTSITNTYVELTNPSRTFGVENDDLVSITASLNFGVSVPAYSSPFDVSVQCIPLIQSYITDLEYIGYPVVNVYSTTEIAIIAPNIVAPVTTIIPNPHLNPDYRSSLVFLPAIYNEKNILTNRNVGPQYQELYNNGNMDVIVKTLSNGFVSVWASNSSSAATDTLMLEQCNVNTDDWVTFGTDFALANQGTYKLVAHNGINQMVVYNPTGGQDELIRGSEVGGVIGSRKWGVGPFTSSRPIRVVDAESVRLGDLLRISSPVSLSTWFPNTMIGSFPITAIGYVSLQNGLSGNFDPTQISVYVDITVSSGLSTALTIPLSGNKNAIGFTGKNPSYGFREFAGYTVNNIDPTLANVYLQPDLNDIRMSASVGTEITALYKMNYPTSVIQGIDGYIAFSGLIKLAHWVIDGVSTNSSSYPGVRAAGTQVEVLTPLLKAITIDLTLDTNEGVSKSTVAQISQSTVAGYINSLPVGSAVILSEIIKIVQSLSGVYSIEVTSTFPVAQNGKIPVGNIEKAYILDASTDIVIS